MNVILTDRWPRDMAFTDGDPALPGQVEWCRLIPKVHRALAGSTEPTLFPRFRCDFDGEEARAYWEAGHYLLVRLIGWEPKRLGEALRGWYRAGRPTLDDPRLEMLKSIWDDQRQLGLLALWASGHAVYGDDYSLDALAEAAFGPLDFRGVRIANAPFVGGTNPLHLGHSVSSEDDIRAVLMSPRPAGGRAAVIVESMRGWHGALERLGSTLPSIATDHWRVDVYARPVGWLGEFRRSGQTGCWFQGRHAVHSGWVDR